MRWLALTLLTACGRIEFAALPDAAVIPDVADASTADACLAVPCPAFATFCDSFEATPPTFSNWTGYQRVNFGGGQVDPGTTAFMTNTPSCGAPAVDTRVVGASQWNQLFAPLSGNPAYVRAMMYLPSTNPLNAIDTMGVGDTGMQFLLLNVTETGSVSINASAGITVTGTTASGVITRDRWHCIEIALTRAANATGHYTASVDGTVVIDSAGVTEPNVTMPVDQIIIGNSTPGSQVGTVDIYFDDVAVAAQPVGCI